MKQIFNIFSKNEKPKQIEQPKKIIADYREKNSLLPAELIALGINIEFKELKVADYIVNDVAIERKTVSDFLSSMINKRLLNQLEEIKQYQNKLLIIEGIEEQELYSEKKFKELGGLHPNSIRGFLLSILLKHKIPVLFSKNYKDTAKFIHILSKKEEKELSLKANKKSLNKQERMQFILEGFPGIGPKNAKKLLEEFKSLKNIINASEKELNKTLGKKAKPIKRIIEDEY